MDEIWIEYHRSYYYRSNKIVKKCEVSNYGRLRINDVIQEPKTFRNGKYYACPNSPYSPTLHRTIALLFIPNPDNKPCVDHIDGNPHNNRVDNLRWCTHKENNNNPITKQRMCQAQKLYFATHDAFFKGKHHTEEAKQKMSAQRKGVPRKTPIWNKGLTNCYTEETIKKQQESRKKTMALKTQEQIKEQYKKVAEKVKGNTNVKGYIHINNGIQSKMINPNELEQYINNGWTKGRLKRTS